MNLSLEIKEITAIYNDIVLRGVNNPPSSHLLDYEWLDGIDGEGKTDCGVSWENRGNTSTPVCLKVKPMNQLIYPRQKKFQDLSGIKIYESFSEELLKTLIEEKVNQEYFDDKYEEVTVAESQIEFKLDQSQKK